MTAAERRRAKRATSPPQRIIGIDPGSMVTGWGVIEAAGGSLIHLAHGTIVATGTQGQGERLSGIYRGIQKVIEVYKPDGISLEKVFFARNAQSALKLGQARGVALLAADLGAVTAYEYTAAEIKVAVVGYGQATKEQVQKMVIALLRLPGKLAADAADALAAAICHHHRQSFQARILEAVPDWPRATRRRRPASAWVK